MSLLATMASGLMTTNITVVSPIIAQIVEVHLAHDNPQEFSVYWFDEEDCSYPEARFIGAREAVELAKSLATRPAAAMGIIRRVIITDGGDFTVFEWKAGEGVTFPPHNL